MYKVILFIVFYLGSIAAVSLYFMYNIRCIHDNLYTLKFNRVLKEILYLPFENLDINEAAEKIISNILKSYGISYCSIFVFTEDRLITASSNVDIKYLESLERYVDKSFKTLSFEPQLKVSNTILSYETAEERNIKYSMLLPLKVKEEVIGTMLIESKNKRKMKNIESEILNALVNNISIVLLNIVNQQVHGKEKY